MEQCVDAHRVNTIAAYENILEAVIKQGKLKKIRNRITVSTVCGEIQVLTGADVFLLCWRNAVLAFDTSENSRAKRSRISFRIAL